MPKNTHDILRTLISKVKCKPGWSFALVGDSEEGFRLRITDWDCQNAYLPDQSFPLSHFFPVPTATYNEASWRRWIFDCCRGVENHELGEWFVIDGDRPFAPLHGPGENPYVVHEYRPATDALITQDGSMREGTMSKIDEIEKHINAGEDITIESDGTVRAMTSEEVAAREADEKAFQEKVATKANKPILCLDFDGVIHSYSSGWQGADVIPDPPVDGAIAFMLEALNHFNVVIFSSRSNQRGGLRAMQAWLRKHSAGAWYESPAGPGLEDVRFATEKPSAMVTLDDRAITFTGRWPTIETLKEFKPWNKR